MAFEYINKLPTPAEVKEIYPLPAACAAIKAERDEEVKRIISGESDRFIVIIGPCSADHEDSVLDYVSRLTKVQEDTKERLLIIPRVYTNKPRTTGVGYQGMLHQPDPEKQPSMADGLHAIRHIHMRVLEETGLSTADEMLYPDNVSYLDDIMSYIAVGARSVENQQHRLVSSGCHVPVGMKNPTSGTLSVMLNSVYAAQHGQEFIMRDWEVKTDGNPWAHCILRGSVNKHGESQPNYHFEDLMLLYELYQEHELENPAVIVDANHANSNKQYREQIRIVREVLHSREQSPELKGFVKGVMIESYIEEGAQKIGEDCYGKSITDPCLGWEDSECLLYEIADSV